MPLRSIRSVLMAAILCTGIPIASSAQSQFDLHVQADTAYRRADSTLNAVYRHLLARYRSDSLATQKLRAAQRAWIAYRDAQVEATYPASDKQAAYGSVYPMCVLMALKDLTEARIAELRAALEPEEGDVCAGGPA